MFHIALAFICFVCAIVNLRMAHIRKKMKLPYTGGVILTIASILLMLIILTLYFLGQANGSGS